jgi:uncharacterized protein (TIGR02117 family)
MRPMRKLLTAASLGAALLLAACGGNPPAAEPPQTPVAAPPMTTVYVLRRGRHTDLVLPADQVQGPLAALNADFPGARYLVYGFGDRQYVLATHQNLAHTLLAPLPGAGLMLVIGLKQSPAEVYGAEHLLSLPLPQTQARALEDFIWQSLQADEDGAVKPYMPGKYPSNFFYASSKTYDGLYTCNTWTAEALKKGGLPVRSFGVLFARQVWEQVQALASAPAPVQDVIGTAPSGVAQAR